MSIRTTSHTCFFSVCLTNVHYSRLDFLFIPLSLVTASTTSLFRFCILKSLGLVLLHSFKYFLLSTTISDSVFKTCLLQLGIRFHFVFFHYKYNISFWSSTSFFFVKTSSYSDSDCMCVSVCVCVYF